MKYLIRRLLDDSTVSKSVTKKWIEMLRSDVCDYSHAYVVVKGTITVERDNDIKKRDKKLFF